METFELSRLVFESCDRIHQAATDLYENIHESGSPRYDAEGIEVLIRDFRDWINHEVDTIRSATEEYRDDI